MFRNFIGKCHNYFYSHYHFCPIKLSKMRLPIGIMLFILFSKGDKIVMVIPIGLLYHIIRSSPQTLIALTEQILKIHNNQPRPQQ